MPNDATLHEFLSLVLFAQGKYEPAAAPLYAVLSVGPGWDWTTLIGNYADANLYTTQLRALEAYVKANPKAAQGRFVLAYHYITQGHGDAAVDQLKEVVASQPNDTLSAQLLGKLQPAAGTAAGSHVPTAIDAIRRSQADRPMDAQSPQNAKITLSIKDGGGFTWAFTIPGKPPTSITGTSTVAGDVLNLASKNSQVGPLTGQVAWQDDAHFVFKATGAPADDPGLKFGADALRRGIRLFRPIFTRVDRWIKPQHRMESALIGGASTIVCRWLCFNATAPARPLVSRSRGSSVESTAAGSPRRVRISDRVEAGAEAFCTDVPRW